MAEGFVAVRHGAWPLATQILVERAAKGDVENLNSTADRENGHAARARDRDERHLRCIAYGIDSTEAGMRRRSVTIGSDVFTACEHESAHCRERGAGPISRQHRRKGQGDETRALERANVRGVQGDALAAIDEAARRRHGDRSRRPHDVWDAGPPNKGQ